MAFDFNGTGNLVATRRKTCNRTNFLTSFAIIVELKNQCAEYVQVYNETGVNALTGTTNKAWTNRVWSSAQRRPSMPLQHPCGQWLCAECEFFPRTAPNPPGQ